MKNEKIARTIYAILFFSLLVLIMAAAYNGISKDTKRQALLRNTCFPYQVVDSFYSEKELYAICARTKQEFKIIKGSHDEEH